MINGILNIYKEKGYTSHDVVARLRRIVGQKKIGHTGTLDPDAEGVLPVCLGRATKVCDMLTEKDKTYEAVLLLGRETDTQDVSGKVLRQWDEDEVHKIDIERIRDCIRGFVGPYDQTPPMYSALKINGKKLYELAREGKTIERKSRRVWIDEIRIHDIALPRIHMEVECSKGTYIRTLCHDIGGNLGTGGCMETLKRTKVGPFRIEDSVRLDQVEKCVREGDLENILISIDHMFLRYQAVTVSEPYFSFAYNGNPIPLSAICERSESPDLTDAERVRIYDSEGKFIAIYKYEKRKKQFLAEKMFFDREEL